MKRVRRGEGAQAAGTEVRLDHEGSQPGPGSVAKVATAAQSGL